MAGDGTGTPGMIPASQVALALGTYREAVVRRIQRGEIRGTVVEGKWLVEAGEVTRILAIQEQTKAEAAAAVEKLKAEAAAERERQKVEEVARKKNLDRLSFGGPS